MGRYIKLPKLGYVKVRQSMEVGNIHHVTIEHTPSGKYFAVLNVEFEPEPRPNQGGTIGIDVGIKTFYSDSNGNTVANPKYLERSMRKLVREQRRLSRREKGSHNRDKQRIRVAKVHEKVTNQRNDFLQKQSTMLVCENQTICIEDLHVKGMIRNHKLAKSIASVSWAKFFEMLEYKAVWYGNEIRKVPTMYPSSQTCSSCGYRNPLVKNLRIRIWECPGCHAVHDRDTNAGINILKKRTAAAVGIKIRKLYRRACGNSINIACGHRVRHCSTVRYLPMQWWKKQESPCFSCGDQTKKKTIERSSGSIGGGDSFVILFKLFQKVQPLTLEISLIASDLIISCQTEKVKQHGGCAEFCVFLFVEKIEYSVWTCCFC